MRVFIGIFIFMLFFLFSQGQEMLGLKNSNYAGVLGIGLNPSSMHASHLYMDFNLFSVNSNMGNDYVFIGAQQFNDLVFRGEEPVYYTSEGERRNFSIYRNNGLKYGNVGAEIYGPGGMMVYGKHAFGFSTAMRTYSSFTNLPPDMANFIYEAIDYNAQHNIEYSHDKPIRMGSLSWTELNFSYAYNFRRYKWDYWSAGITIKPLFGMAGVFTNLNKVDYEVFSDTTAYIYDASFDYGYAVPIDPETNEYTGNPFFQGFGFGVDIGVTYQFTTKGHGNGVFDRLCEQVYDDYNYKIGVSLLDLGYIKFSKNAGLRNYENVETYWDKASDTLSVNSINDLNRKIDYYFSDSPDQNIEADKITMQTPPALSIQFDYHFKKSVYFNTTLIYGFNIGRAYVKRASVWAFTPRLETSKIEVSLPISFYEWDWAQPRIGFALRYGNFFFGFDRLNTMLGINDFTGFDFYFGLRLNLTRNFRMQYVKGNCNPRIDRNIETFDFRNF